MITDTKAAAPRPSVISGLNARDRKKVAREARQLAMECLTNGPRLTNSWCGCAIGLSLKRAGLLPKRWTDQQRLGLKVEAVLDPSATMWNAILSEATCERLYRDNPTAVVFPLLALADALDGQRGTAPEGSP